jgi:hypothetical protein
MVRAAPCAVNGGLSSRDRNREGADGLAVTGPAALSGRLCQTGDGPAPRRRVGQAGRGAHALRTAPGSDPP